MSDLDLTPADRALDARARAAAADLRRAAHHRPLPVPRRTAGARRPMLIVTLATAAVAVVLVGVIALVRERSMTPVEENLADMGGGVGFWAVDPLPVGWQLTAAIPGVGVVNNSSPLRRMVYATSAAPDGPVIELINDQLLLDFDRSRVREAHAGDRRVILSDRGSGLDDVRSPDRPPELLAKVEVLGAIGPTGEPDPWIDVRSSGIAEIELLAIAATITIGDDDLPRIPDDALPAAMTAVVVGDFVGQAPGYATLFEAFGGTGFVVEAAEVTGEGVSSERWLRVMAVRPTPGDLAAIGLTHRRLDVADVADAVRWVTGDELGPASVAWLDDGLLFMMWSASFTTGELTAMSSSARRLSADEIAPILTSPTEEVAPGTVAEAPAATEAANAEEQDESNAPAPTDPSPVQPASISNEVTNLELTVEALGGHQIRASGSLPDGAPFAAEITIVFDQWWLADALAGPMGGGSGGGVISPDGEQQSLSFFAYDTGQPGNPGERVTGLAGPVIDPRAVAVESLWSDGSRHRVELVGVPARPEVRFGLAVARPGELVSYRVVDQSGETLHEQSIGQ